MSHHQPQFAVEHRPPGVKKWTVIVTAGSRAAATDAMFDLMKTKTGDWAVREITDATPAMQADSLPG